MDFNKEAKKRNEDKLKEEKDKLKREEELIKDKNYKILIYIFFITFNYYI